MGKADELPDRLEGRSLFVAGGTGGINLAIGLAAARAGVRVAVLGRNSEKAKGAQEALRRFDPDALAVTADVRDLEALTMAVEQVVGILGPLDCVVSGAAGNFIAPAEKLSSNGFRAVVDIDLIGTFHCFKAVRPHLNPAGASLLAISSGQAFHPMWGQAHASAAKAGVESLVRTLALEWGPAGIRVNSLCPGPISATEGVERLIPAERFEAIARRLPLRRFGSAEEVAQAALFLLGPQASFVTGTTLHCDGGMMLAFYDGQPSSDVEAD